MKYWYALIVVVCLLIITTFVFSANPTISKSTSAYLIKNNLMDYGRSEVVKETNFITKKDWCSETIYNEIDFYHVLGFDCSGLKNDVILSKFKLLEVQKLNEYVLLKLKQENALKAKIKNTRVVIASPTKVVVASAINKKGEIAGKDSKAVVKDACWFEILGYCIWK